MILEFWILCAIVTAVVAAVRGGHSLLWLLIGCLLGPILLRGRAFDVIFVYGTSPILQAIPAIFLKWLKGARLVLWVQDLWPESLEATGYVTNRRFLNLVGGVVRWIYGRANLRPSLLQYVPWRGVCPLPIIRILGSRWKSFRGWRRTPPTEWNRASILFLRAIWAKPRG